VNQNPNKLFVEGHDDLRSVVGLMRHHVKWSEKKTDAPVWIEIGSGVTKILQKEYLSTLMKDPSSKVLGVMLDADLDAGSRYDSFRKLCLDFFPTIPKTLPESGLIVDNSDGKRLGLWIMPDNASQGAMEMFLKFLVPPTEHNGWEHAVKSTLEAKTIGCKYKECHLDKAHLYSWLAWQDEPGQSPGNALTSKILDPKSPSATTFVNWMIALYSLQRHEELFV